ncbi:MAG: hypothetical protein R3190_16835, partial [Thermoanaerobaculia bacterium]|nr:hypothetical protein [Thermoanaerobaculia bacterium]
MSKRRHGNGSAAGNRAFAAALAGLLVACGGRPLAEVEGRERVLDEFRRLHSAVYGVYELGPDRDRIHELLAASFAGEALTREYVEHFTTLVRMATEHTGIRVLRVDYEDVAVVASDEDEVEVAADWSVGGIVSHQLHRHHRVNRYQATYTLARVDGPGPGLRIVSSRVRNAERIRN